MSRRHSVHISGFTHSSPVPNASRIDNMLFSGVIIGADPSTGKANGTFEEQLGNVFLHMKAIVEAVDGTTDDIIKVNFYLKNSSDRTKVNVEWVKMFSDEHSRPARQALVSALDGTILVQADFIAVLKA